MNLIRKPVFGISLTLWIFSLMMQSTVCKKQTTMNLLESIVDAKELKKMCRTKNNVLILFTKSTKQSSELITVFSKAAEEIRGVATLALVDCSSDAKKLCRKLKVSPEPHLLKHYKDGDFHKDYDRKHTVQSIVNFLKDPAGDLPWEEDERAIDVFHISDANILGKLIKREKLPIMVMFYAPWCGFCKRLKPEYEAVASDLKGISIMAAMDVNKPENAIVRQHFNITGFPTLLYFESGKMKHKYDGDNTKEGLLNFMKNPEKQPEKPKEEEWSDKSSEVVHLTDDTFDSTLSQESSVLVMFYAPWCGHCNKMKPEYESAAASIKDQDIPGVLAAVNAVKEKALADRFKISGYPTVKYFKNGEVQYDVNFRTADKLLEFMNDPKEPPPPPPPELPWSEEASDVVHLTEEDFKPFLKRKKHVLLMFYAPWCGHCKRAKPEFTAAAATFKDDSKIEFAAVDCTAHASVCSAHNVKGYPTLKYFNYYKVEKPYEGGRTEKDFVDYMRTTADVLPAHTYDSPEQFWAGVPNADLVHTLKDGSFHNVLNSKKSALVMFYAPWSGHCKALRPTFAAAAAELKKQNVDSFFGAIDGTTESSIITEYSISQFTTVKYFRNGKFIQNFDGRALQEIVDFMKSSSEVKEEL